MAALVVTKCAGLYTNPNDLGDVPDGALSQADNVSISRDGMIEPRRGFETVDADASRSVKRFGDFAGKVVAASDGSPALDYSANGSSWSSGPSLSGVPRRLLSAGGSLYVATSAGVDRIASLSGTALPAGVPQASDMEVRSIPGSIVEVGSSVAYRAIWTYKDASGRRYMGAPSSRSVFTETEATGNPIPNTSVPPGLPTGAIAEFYRSEIVGSGLVPSDELALVGSRSVPEGRTVTDLARTGGATVTATTSEAHGYQPGDVVSLGHGTVSGSGGSSFTRGTVTILSAPTPTTVTWEEVGDNGSATGLTIETTVLAVGIVDTLPDNMRGESLYTDASQDGSEYGHFPPPVAIDLAEFRGCVFYARTTDRQRLRIQLLPTGGDTGLQASDTITIGGTVFTAGATEIPDDETNTFDLHTGGSSAYGDVQDTALSLVRAINRYGAGLHDIQATYASGPNDVSGVIDIWRSALGGSAFSVSSSRATAWLGLGSSVAEVRKNGLSWSQQDQPDAVPLVNYTLVGSADKEILRVVPLRDSLIVLKEDGIWRLTGDSPAAFRVDPLDLTVVCVAPETAAALENTVFCLSRFGVVRISDTGVSVVSRPVEDQLAPLVAPATVATTTARAFGIAYESAHKYLLWVPSAASDTRSTQAFIYDVFTQTWARSTVSGSCGYVSTVDDRLYLGTSSGDIKRERKALTPADYADEPVSVSISSHAALSVTLASAVEVSVGDRLAQGSSSAVVAAISDRTLTLDRTQSWSNAAATVLKAFSCSVRWATKFGDDPGAIIHAREADFLLRSGYFAAAEAFFATDLSPDGESVPLSGSALGLVDPPSGPRSLRVWLPRAEQRGSRVSVGLSWTQAQCDMKIQGLKLIYEPGSERTSR